MQTAKKTAALPTFDPSVPGSPGAGPGEDPHATECYGVRSRCVAYCHFNDGADAAWDVDLVDPDPEWNGVYVDGAVYDFDETRCYREGFGGVEAGCFEAFAGEWGDPVVYPHTVLFADPERQAEYDRLSDEELAFRQKVIVPIKDAYNASPAGGRDATEAKLQAEFRAAMKERPGYRGRGPNYADDAWRLDFNNLDDLSGGTFNTPYLPH